MAAAAAAIVGATGTMAKPAPKGPSPTSYEAYAPRTASQRSRLARIAALTVGPSSASAGEHQDTADGAGAAASRPSLLEAMSPPPPPPAAAAAERSSSSASNDPIAATLSRTYDTSDRLTTTLKHTTSLRLALRASINIGEDISKRHADLLRHSGELSAAAERLQAEEATLSRHAKEIGMPLKHYDAVDRIGPTVGVLFKDGGRTVVRGLARIKVDNEDFPDVLDDIDAAVEFFGDNGGREALQAIERTARSRRDAAEEALLSGTVQYYKRALTLHEAALYLIREAVADRINQTTKDVTDALNLKREPIAADKLEASLVYTRFHGISSRSNVLIGIVKARADRTEQYQDLLTMCRNAYCGARESLLRLTVRSHMDKLRERHGLVGMTRLASVFLIRLCTIETSLYLDFFGDRENLEERKKSGDNETEKAGGKADDSSPDAVSAAGGRKTTTAVSGTTNPVQQAASLASQVMAEDNSEFQQLLSTLCSSLHRTVRRGLVSIHDLDTLCQVVSVLREERSLASSSPTTMAAARAISAVIVDAQERLIFCANTALTKEVVRFKATPADLDYPDRLKPGYKAPPTAPAGGEKEGSKDTENTSGATALSASEEVADDAVKAQLKVYESWFPPMRSVLRVLSKIFRVVEPRVFEDIALQSVQSCTRSLKDGSAYILNKSGVIHADLFLVKNLLILREQLSPFDIQLRSVERQLDFSEAGKAVSRFLANRNRRLFSMSTENALVTLLREGVSVQEASVDSKRDLDDALRSACNDFIEHTSVLLAGPLLDFVGQCKLASSSSNASLKTQPFIEGGSVKALMSKTTEDLSDELKEVTTQMALYLDNPATQSILLKPVVRKITRAVDDSRKFIEDAVDGEHGWDEGVREEVMTALKIIETAVKSGSTKQLVGTCRSTT